MILGVKHVTSTTLTNVTPDVKECRDFMKSKETRDALQVLFVPNDEALKSLLPHGVNLSPTFSEALIDLGKPSESFSKNSDFSNLKNMLVIILNFTILIGVSAYNFWQFRIITGLDQPKKSEQAAKFGLVIN